MVISEIFSLINLWAKETKMVYIASKIQKLAKDTIKIL